MGSASTGIPVGSAGIAVQLNMIMITMITITIIVASPSPVPNLPTWCIVSVRFEPWQPGPARGLGRLAPASCASCVEVVADVIYVYTYIVYVEKLWILRFAAQIGICHGGTPQT